MIRDQIQQLKRGPRELRQFGLLVGGVLARVGLLCWLRHKAQYPYWLWPGVALLALGATVPRMLKGIYLAWMALAIVLGFVMSHVLLTLLFFLVFVPVGLVARLLGQDFLSLKLDRQAPSYWRPRPREAARSRAEYERQF